MRVLGHSVARATVTEHERQGRRLAGKPLHDRQGAVAAGGLSSCRFAFLGGVWSPTRSGCRTTRPGLHIPKSDEA